MKGLIFDFQKELETAEKHRTIGLWILETCAAGLPNLLDRIADII